MNLTKTDVEHIAKLARLELTEAEKEQYVTELSAILSYVDRLKELDTREVVPTAHITSELGALRPDVAHDAPQDVREGLVNAFPATKAGLLSVPPVFSDYKE